MTIHLAFFLLLLSSFLLPSKPSYAKVFLSLDCGGSQSSTDDNSIKWTPDDSYIHTGSIESQLLTTTPYVFNTLRVFPTRKKNCYTINVPYGEKILARASFYYGNYDGKYSPPSFDLQFDGNHWNTVNTSSYVYTSYEAIYTVKKNSTSICLARTHSDQVPFISTLELRSLEPTMYSRVHPSYPLILTTRFAFNADTSSIRYPADEYDRIWICAQGTLMTSITNSAPTVSTIDVEDNPPKTVFQYGATPTYELSTFFTPYIILQTGLPDTAVPVYITMFFSEMDQLSSSDRRSFRVLVDDQPVSKPIIPPYGSAVEEVVSGITASSSTNITLMPTSDSTLGPILSAFEVYIVGSTLTSGTNFNDVLGLTILQATFEILLEWTGDPCLPSQFSWEWVECSDDAVPRVIAINLSGYGLFGEIPDFSSMDALQTIDMHNNSLYGPIPEFLGSLTSLTVLNVADNRLNGTIPVSLSQNSHITLEVTNNCFSGVSCKPSHGPGTPATPNTGDLSPPDFNIPPTPDFSVPVPQNPGSIPIPRAGFPGRTYGGRGSGSDKTHKLSITLSLLMQISLLCVILKTF